MKSIWILAIAMTMSACQQHRVTVTAIPNVAAVRESNTQTRKHIQHTQEHISKVQKSEAVVDDKLNSVEKDLEALLKK